MHCQKTLFLSASLLISILALISSFECLSSQFVAPLSPQFVAPVFCDMSFPQSDAAVAAAATATHALVRLDAFTEENVEQ